MIRGSGEHLPAATVLHRSLAEAQVLPSLGKRFNASNWVIDTADQIIAGEADDELHRALLRYLRGEPNISMKAWSVLRRTPWLPDQHGNPQAPQDLILISAAGTKLLAPALLFVRKEDQKNPHFARFDSETP